MESIEQILDLDRYPIDRPDSSAYRALVKKCKDDLAEYGMYNLNQFMRQKATDAAAKEIYPRFVSESFHHKRLHNIYFKKHIPNLPSDHPALQIHETSNHTLCADQLTETTPIQIYQYQPLIDFIAATMDKPKLYQMDDSIAKVNFMAYHEGEALNWHFDRSEFTVTLLLQKPDAGGLFEYRSDLRTDNDPNYDGVAKLLCGSDPEKKLMDVDAGTLNIFRGKNTAHRVTPIEGDKARIISVFSYFDRPDVCFSTDELLGFYGRAEPVTA